MAKLAPVPVKTAPKTGVKPSGKGVPLAKPTTAKTAAKAPAKTAPKVQAKPFEDGEIVLFKGYAAVQENPQFTEGEELAIVTVRTEGEGDDAKLYLGAVKAVLYHKYKADPDTVDGEELSATEVKRTHRRVEKPFTLVAVGDMKKLMSETADPVDMTLKLFEGVQKSFFYIGGALSKLKREASVDTGLPLYTNYSDDAGKNYEAGREGWERFVSDKFGTAGAESGTPFGVRKADYLMQIYDQFSTLPNATEVVKRLGVVGWTKAKTIVPYVTADNATELLDKAETSSVAELSEHLRTTMTTSGSASGTGVGAGTTKIRRTVFTFSLFEDQAEGVKFILDQAKKTTGISDPNALFEHIVTEWAGSNLGDAKEKATAKAAKKYKDLVKAGVKVPSDHPNAKAATAKAA